jgi:hypothetical protein
MEMTKRFSLTGADLRTIELTLSESQAVHGLFSTTKGAREKVQAKVATLLHNMEATFTVNDEEPQ